MVNRRHAVGVDIVEIRRIATLVQRWGERFLERVYTPEELAYCQGRPEQLAARFAAKEAISKALGTGIGAITWREMEVVRDQVGRPMVRLHGSARCRAEKLGVSDVVVSLSHGGEYAIAFASAFLAGESQS